MGRFPGQWKAAVSLTFDDGLPCQREHAVPILDAHRLPGTFFLIVKSNYDPVFQTKEWLEISKRHEIGSHSVFHRKAAELTNKEMLRETADSKRFLENVLKIRVDSFCYPYTDAPAGLQEAVRRAGYKVARGGRIARTDKYLLPGGRYNLMNVPAYHIGQSTFTEAPDAETPFQIVDAALAKEAWVTLMFHGVGPDFSQWDNVSSESFTALCAHLVKRRQEGLWVETFGRVARCFQQKP